MQVWQLYGRLAKEHADQLRSKLDVETAVVILLQVCWLFIYCLLSYCTLQSNHELLYEVI
jgi:hypothetical protein